ncbi:methionine--tRNA ligase [Candidatus Microgenomates bacterium]|nr:methionine--tRNA ligase [Candidatus Microgenomates bacterium]
MTNKFYLTTAIPYVNAKPHIGHALEFIQADCVARYHKLLGEDTLLLSGADENSLKNVQAAEDRGVPVKQLCDENSKAFSDLLEKLNVSVNIFQRASEKKHFESSQKLWQRCQKNGDIYKKSYEGLYCIGCEAFYTEDELENGLCPEHKTRPEKISEENYFFRLSKYQKQIEELIEGDELKLIPATRKNEALGFIRGGLEDFSISRSQKRARGWGVPVPNDSNQIMYVWFDALNIYQSGVGFGWDEKSYQQWWPADLHIIGKGILRFHAVYWPAILLSAGLPLPKSIFVHGYITAGGQKISKSLGNVIDPIEMIEKYGVDSLRYYLLREIPAYSDGDFSERRFKEIYNADLANGLGNLVARTVKLCEKIDTEFKPLKAALSEDYKNDLGSFCFDEALATIWDEIRSLDRYLEKEKPWLISDISKLFPILEFTVGRILQIAYELQPFLPETAEKIQKQFAGPQIKSGPPLFPRL